MWPGLLDLEKNECLAILRRLELDAYSGVVSALRAQGELTRDRRRVLHELSSMLNVSVDRHKTEIRRAVNDELLATIAKYVSSGVNNDHEWIREGRRLVPLLRRAPPSRTTSRATADAIASDLDEVNKTLRHPTQTRTAPKRGLDATTTTSPSVPLALDQLLNANGHVEAANLPSVSLPRISSENEEANVVLLPSGQAIRITPKPSLNKTTSTNAKTVDTNKMKMEGKVGPSDVKKGSDERPTKRRRGKMSSRSSNATSESSTGHEEIDPNFKDAKIEVFPSLQHMFPRPSTSLKMPMPSTAALRGPLMSVPVPHQHRPLLWASNSAATKMPPPLKKPCQAARQYNQQGPTKRSSCSTVDNSSNESSVTVAPQRSSDMPMQYHKAFYKPANSSTLTLGQSVALPQGIMALNTTPLYNGESNDSTKNNRLYKNSDTIAIPVVSFANKARNPSIPTMTTTTEAPSSFILLQRTPTSTPMVRNVGAPVSTTPRILYTKTGKPLVIVSEPIAPTHNNALEDKKNHPIIKDPNVRFLQQSQQSSLAIPTMPPNTNSVNRRSEAENADENPVNSSQQTSTSTMRERSSPEFVEKPK